MDALGRDRVLILPFETTRAAPSTSYNRALAFLGSTHRFALAPSTAFPHKNRGPANQRVDPCNPSPAHSTALRNLAALYIDEYTRLRRLLERIAVSVPPGLAARQPQWIC